MITATEKANAITIATATYMQDVSTKLTGGCPDTLITEKAYSLVDRRDTRAYYVAKLADGNCWMIQNLRLGMNTTTLALTSKYSDVSNSGFTLNGKLSDGKFVRETINGVQYQNNSSQYYCATNYGCYYNWYTATAGSGTTYTTSGDATYSICPVGWILPSQSDWTNLSAAYSDTPTKLLVSPTNLTENTNGSSTPGLVLGGLYNYGGGFAVSDSAYYWARTTNGAQNGRHLFASASSVNVAGSNGKYEGNAVRCMLK